MPTKTFEQWDNDYNVFKKYLTKRIMTTQVGLSSLYEGVYIWWCYPSALTHVQLDTTTMIFDNISILGEWRVVSNRKITFTDSACYADKVIYRNEVIDNIDKDDDLYLNINSEKIKLYLKEKDKKSFRRLLSRNYIIESNRFLLMYRLSVGGSSVSQIGIDKDGRLILNSYFVQERKIKGVYIVYQSTMTQLIFKKMNE
jgi:hypothetical protein